MSLNGWYKNLNPNVPTLYQFSNNALQVSISKRIDDGVYTGDHYVGNPPVWTPYTSQNDMADIWTTQFNGATPLPGAKIPAKK